MTNRNHSERGQVLPLVALFMIVLIGFAALAIDVSGALSARRFYRSVADGAALAGAQDLQATGSRAVTGGDRIRARQHAMNTVVSELNYTGALPAACDTSADADITDACVLTGTSYHVSIRAGVYAGQVAPIVCSECNPARSVQVGIRNGEYALTFARVLGQATWNVGVTSVAGLQWAKSYTIVTLRPPARVGSTYDVRDIKLDGGTHVTVSEGDVATNADMVWTGIGSWLCLTDAGSPCPMTSDPGFGVFYADWTGPQGWPSPPTGTKIFNYVQDPNYVYPAMSGSQGTFACNPGPATNCAPTFTDARESTCGAPSATAACTTPALDPSGCGAEVTYLQGSVYTFMATQDTAKIYCYKPGIYDPSSNSRQLVAGPADLVILMPGAYYFKSPNGGLDIGGRIVGGYRPGVAGVALMFDECNNAHCIFTANNALAVALNVGTKWPPGTSGTSALAARDWNNAPVQTSGPSSPTPPILITLLVNKDVDGPGGTQACVVPPYPDREPSACDASHNTTINMAGGGSLAIEGVQYAPTDNVAISGGSAGVGQVGQIWAWTINYTGGTQINQQGVGSLGPGVLRLDSACTAPGTPCNP